MEVISPLRLVSDQRLAEHVAAGSDRAFEVLYDRHARAILTFCRHLLGSREEAEDALQHTFMAAYRDLVRSGPPAAVRPWLYVIARNHCISLLRARRELPAADVPERAVDRLGSDVAVREELRSVFAALSRLPDDQRSALVLAELGDASHDEIAQILDCRRDQVKSYVYQARAALLADRLARDTSCADIRAQLSELRGAQLRRTPLRRHLDDCPGCREFRDALRAQRRQLRVLLPVVPAFGLKRAVLGAVLGGGGSGGAVSVGGLAATALVVVAIPVGGVAIVRDEPPRATTSEPAVARSVDSGAGERATGGNVAAPRGRDEAPGRETAPRGGEGSAGRGDGPRGAESPREGDEPAAGETPRGDEPRGEEPPARDTPRHEEPRGGDEPPARETPGDEESRGGDEQPARETPRDDERRGGDEPPARETPRDDEPRGRDTPRGNDGPRGNDEPRGNAPDAPPGQTRRSTPHGNDEPPGQSKPRDEPRGNAPDAPPGQTKPRDEPPGNAPDAPPGQTKPRDEPPGNAPETPPGQTKPRDEPPGQAKPRDEPPGKAPEGPPGKGKPGSA